MDERMVLVTGGTGFLAAYCIAALLEQGYAVRTTVRSSARQPRVTENVAAVQRASGRRAGSESLSFAVADLTADKGWDAAVAGCGYVLHVASPFPGSAPEDENELIVPAREGTVRVLRAARDAGVRRTVVTSSFAAIGYGHPATERAFTEQDWTDAEAELPAYIKSKALAERAAWEFVDREGGGMELAVVNPVGIFGPAFGPDMSSSLRIIEQMVAGRMPGVPNLAAAVVDVRDAADLHLKAMTSPKAAGERFIAAAGDAVSFRHIARTLRERLGADGAKVVTRPLPSWVVRLAARFAPAFRSMTPNLDVVRHVDNTKARTVLEWTPRSSEDTVTATATSLIALGLVAGS